MKSFKQMSEGGGVIKSLAFFLRNKLGSNVKSGLSSTNVSEKLDATLSAIGLCSNG